MHDPEMDALAREARRARRLPPNAVCEKCGTRQHLKALPDARVICYECRRRETGGAAVEEDHVAGRTNLGGIVVRLRANDHRTVTELRTRLGIDDWPVAGDDLRLTLAHLLAGLATVLLLVAQTLVEQARGVARAFPVVP